MENIRARTNRAFIKHMVQNGGKTIKHSDNNDKLPSLYEDSCRLSFILNAFEEALSNSMAGIAILSTYKPFVIFDI